MRTHGLVRSSKVDHLERVRAVGDSVESVLREMKSEGQYTKWAKERDMTHDNGRDHDLTSEVACAQESKSYIDSASVPHRNLRTSDRKRTQTTDGVVRKDDVLVVVGQVADDLHLGRRHRVVERLVVNVVDIHVVEDVPGVAEEYQREGSAS